VRVGVIDEPIDAEEVERDEESHHVAVVRLRQAIKRNLLDAVGGEPHHNVEQTLLLEWARRCHEAIRGVD